MKITKEQIESMEYDGIIKMLKDAVESGDKEFIMSVIPLYDFFIEDAEIAGGNIYEDFLYLFENSNIFEDRDIALELAKYGYELPKDLYGDDKEVILETFKSGDIYYGFRLANDNVLKNKEFVMSMISEIHDYHGLLDLYDEFVLQDECSPIPLYLFEDEEFMQFIKNRLDELKEKKEQEKEDAVYEGMSELAERRMDYYGEYSSHSKFYPSFLDFLKEKELSADGAEKSVIQDLIRTEESDKEQSEEPAETPSELEQLATTKKELEQIVSELRENIASAQKLLASYEELLNGGKQNDSNEGQTFGEE